MICIAYLSTATIQISAGVLNSILDASCRNNLADGITGLLCHYDGSFLQFLEGEPDAVDRLLDKIALDPRHAHILKVYREPVQERAFADWSMAVVRPDVATSAQQAFCRNLRKVELSANAKQTAALDGFLTSFRAWLR